MDAKMPDRGPEDGPVAVQRLDDNRIAISATTNGTPSEAVMSEYNAWRVFGMLAVLLGIPLPSKVAKEIKL